MRTKMAFMWYSQRVGLPLVDGWWAIADRLIQLVSRFNHDCRPNANYWFDPTTLTHNIYATRQIAVGEEISLTYIE